MDTGKGGQLKINILCSIHFTVLAWQQVTQSTNQNSVLKCRHVKKNQEGSDVMEDDIMQDEGWIRLGTSTAGMAFGAYVSVDQELSMCGVLCMEEMCGVVGSGCYVEEVQGDGGDDEA
jgi:hypothetical protein